MTRRNSMMLLAVFTVMLIILSSMTASAIPSGRHCKHPPCNGAYYKSYNDNYKNYSDHYKYDSKYHKSNMMSKIMNSKQVKKSQNK